LGVCPAPPAPLDDLGPLVLAKLVEDAVRQLPLGALVPTVVQRADFCAVLGELPLEEVVVGRLAGDTVAVLGEHHGDAPGGHKVPHPVHARPLEAGPALAGVDDLLHHREALAPGVLPQRLHLLGEGVAPLGLLGRRYAGV
jgi:hypothetical protein